MIRTVKFFAVGTNMDGGHLRRWVPSAQRLTTASLTGFTLSWHKRSASGGKLTPLCTGDAADVVWGVVYDVDGVAWKQVDEGQRAAGYHDERVTVVAPEGVEYEVSVYVAGAAMIDDSTMPIQSYRDPIVKAARSNGLPAEYVDGLARPLVAHP